MRVQQLPISESIGHLLMHNIANAEGRKVLAKGTRLTAREIGILESIGQKTVRVAVLEAGDVHEDEAAERIASAIVEGVAHLRRTRAIGGRVNFHCDENTILKVDALRLTELNLLAGVTVATRPVYTPIGKGIGRSDVATLKIIPYALPETTVTEAVALAKGVIRLVPMIPHKVALLITADEGSTGRIQRQFEAPTRTRLERLGSEVTTVRTVRQTENEIAAILRELVAEHDGVFIGGQTSIMDWDDTTLRGLRMAGIEVVWHGVPVEPGNMLAVGYTDATWVLCAPGCAKSLETNVVDLILPRLLARERLTPRDFALLGMGGLL
jgi:molybdenum cofactor cytidylyltransferase